jgi:hypothetical protein
VGAELFFGDDDDDDEDVARGERIEMLEAIRDVVKAHGVVSIN